MAQFRYLARRADGKLLDGILSCNDRAQAILQVEQQGGIPIKIEPIAEASAQSGKAAPGKSAISRGERSKAPKAPGSALASAEIMAPESIKSIPVSHQHLFTEQLAHLLNAGMTLDEALAVLVRRMKQPRLKGLSQGLHRALIDGRSLSEALRDYPKIFSPLYTNLISAGEVSGALPEVLKRLVVHLADVKALRDRVQQALLYPALLVVAGIGLILVFMTVMVPQLITFFKGSHQPLPAATQILVDFDHLLVSYWWLIPIACFALFAAYKAFVANPEGRKSWDRFTWHAPLYSRIIRYRFFAQFARTLATLMDNGVTLLRSLELLEEISGNEFIRLRMAQVSHAVVDGATLSNALADQQIFPDMYTDMMAVGEQTGNFSSTMQMIAAMYERELDKQIQIVSTLIPPIVMVGIAAVVGSVIFAIMSAVFGLTANLH